MCFIVTWRSQNRNVCNAYVVSLFCSPTPAESVRTCTRAGLFLTWSEKLRHLVVEWQQLNTNRGENTGSIGIVNMLWKGLATTDYCQSRAVMWTMVGQSKWFQLPKLKTHPVHFYSCFEEARTEGKRRYVALWTESRKLIQLQMHTHTNTRWRNAVTLWQTGWRQRF